MQTVILNLDCRREGAILALRARSLEFVIERAAVRSEKLYHLAVSISSAMRPASFAADVIVDAGCDELVRTMAHGRDTVRVRTADVYTMNPHERDVLLAGVSAVVVATTRAGHEQCHDLIRQIRGRNPHISVYVVGRRADRLLSRVRGYALAGAGEVFELESEIDLELFRETISGRVLAPAPRQLIADVHRLTHGSSVAVIAADCVLESFRRRTVESVENRFGRYHKVINEQLRHLGIVCVGELLRAGRLAHAHELRGQRHVTGDQTASTLGFASAKSLAAALRRAKHTGLYRDGRFWIRSRSLSP